MGTAQRRCAEPVPFHGDDANDDREMGWVQHSNAALNPSHFTSTTLRGERAQ